jgi:hypothetical protein
LNAYRSIRLARWCWADLSLAPETKPWDNGTSDNGTSDNGTSGSKTHAFLLSKAITWRKKKWETSQERQGVWTRGWVDKKKGRQGKTINPSDTKHLWKKKKLNEVEEKKEKKEEQKITTTTTKMPF